MSPSRVDVFEVVPPLLRDHPLPSGVSTAGKHDRGTALIVGGSSETPGALLLAGLAALRAGAGRLQLATVASAAAGLAIAVPEARVVGLAETSNGAIDPNASERVVELAEQANAVLIGTGAMDDAATAALLARVVPGLRDVRLIADAGAATGLRANPELLQPLGDRAVVCPNPGEMAALLDRDVDTIRGDPLGSLEDAIARVGVVVALRDAETWMGAPGSERYHDRSGHPALGTSGSGDVLAGFLTGLAARGAGLLDATLWAVHCHGVAGAAGAARVGGIGLLARELLDDLPLAFASIAA
ncbi:MAG: hypothetical protein QOF40_653 [Actinomycetota bacterium]|jgi:hydroxyethylthiazole kinase-like uncharacterized protein yjeF|nr:hypothetical protein [Actinomycetota bacterium]